MTALAYDPPHCMGRMLLPWAAFARFNQGGLGLTILASAVDGARRKLC